MKVPKNSSVQSVTIRVPGTIANLGCGFDSLGVAIELWNTVTVRHGEFKIDIRGKGRETLPKDTTNLLVTGVDAVYDALDLERPALNYTVEQNIPIGSGLGSSSAAIVTGIMAGSVLTGTSLPPEQIIKLAADIEGHADNVAPAVLGGCVIGIHENGQWITDSVEIPDDLSIVIFCPVGKVNTNESRVALPAQVPTSDAIYNLGRGMLLVNALNKGNLSLLKYAMQDRLHQPYRASGIRGMRQLMDAAMKGGALGAFLAGSGPTIAAMATTNQMTIIYEMKEAARLMNIEGDCKVVRCSSKSAHIVGTDE